MTTEQIQAARLDKAKADATKVSVSFTVDRWVHDAITELADAEDRPINRQYPRILREWAEANGHRKP